MKTLLKNFMLLIAVLTTTALYAQHKESVTVVQLSQVEGAYENTSLSLTPGKYIFEVANKNVDKKLGFYLTPTSDDKAQVTNSGLSHLVAKGETARTGIVELKAGAYQYNCPLNPTPHYSLKVAENPAATIENVTVVQLSQIPGEYENTNLTLTPGKYIFEVQNKNVDKELGFYLTPTSDAKAQVSNSGLSHLIAKGETARTGVVELKAGDYQYNCPLNPTPHYSLKVVEKSATTIAGVKVVQLSQVPGQYETTNLDLTPGKYIFEVTNKNVDKQLGFYLTPTSDAKAQVSNSGLSHLVAKGETARTGVVDLKAGNYQYNCPLNPTPHYSLNVSEAKKMHQTMETKLKK